MTRGDAALLVPIAIAATVGLGLVFLGSVEPVDEPPVFDLEPRERVLFDLLEERFGGFLDPRMPAGWPIGGDRLAEGRVVWRTQCQHCHGLTGAADTPTASMLRPRPRDFRASVLKFTSTAAAAPPVRADVVRTITGGIPYTAMSGFGDLPAEDLEAVADYVMYLLLRWQVWVDAREGVNRGRGADALAGALERTREVWNAAERWIVVPPEPRPPVSAASIALGRRLFHSGEVGCSECHGVDGSGTVAASQRRELTDLWQQPAPPREVRSGRFHGGSRPGDLYRRLSEGIKGTPMFPYSEVLGPGEIYSLMDYLDELSNR